jgi:hypothetical protein
VTTAKNSSSIEPSVPKRRLTRSTFVKVVGTTLVASSFLARETGTGFARTLPRPSLRSRDYDAFAARVGERFSIRSGSIRVSARLIAANHQGYQTVAGMRYSRIESFSLVFETAAGQSLEQGTYRLRNARLGTFHLFLVPGNQTKNSNHYEAAVHRFSK